jgi:predicted RNA-binding protein YlxR (DUF448 family)
VTEALALAPETAPDIDADATGPLRRCIVTGKSGPRADFVRFVVGPDATIVPDIAGKLPGRGIWVTATRAALEPAVAKGLFAKAARARVSVGADLAERVGFLLMRRAVESLALCRRAGQAASGFAKVKEKIEKGRCAVLVAAADGSLAERARLGGHDMPVATGLTATEMGEAFGREHAVHAAIAPGALALRVQEDLARLASYRQSARNE